jgi:multiple sugar transport system permease protein
MAVSRKQTAKLANWGLNLILILIALLIMAPFWWVLVTSFLAYKEAFTLPPKWFTTSFTLENYREVFNLVPFGRMAFNSLKISTIVTVGAVTTSTLAAYAFARLRFPGRNVLFLVFLAALMVPQQVTVIPIFVMLRRFHLLNTHEAVYLPALINVFGIFLLRQFFLTIPRDLEDAARIDGAGHLRILWQIIVPLAAPAIAALAIFIFQGTWNDFFWPNILLFSQDKMTLPVGLVALQGARGGGPVVYIFAGLSMVMVPLLILFAFTQRTLTQSIAMTGIKG